MEELCALFIRQPRAQYKLDDLGPSQFALWRPGTGSTAPQRLQFTRDDFVLRNRRGCEIHGSFAYPVLSVLDIEDNGTDSQRARIPVFVYCHGSAASRMDSIIDCMGLLLRYKIGVVAFDFGGCGQSTGDYMSLGYREPDDIQVVLDYVVSHYEQMIASFNFWGRSMGAVAALIYASRWCNMPATEKEKRPPLKSLVLDSPFANLWELAEHVVENYKTATPRVLLSGLAAMGLPLVRSAILKKVPGFDIRTFESTAAAAACGELNVFCFHGEGDDFVPHSQSKALFDAYGTGKKIIPNDTGDTEIEGEIHLPPNSGDSESNATTASPSLDSSSAGSDVPRQFLNSNITSKSDSVSTTSTSIRSPLYVQDDSVVTSSSRMRARVAGGSSESLEAAVLAALSNSSSRRPKAMRRRSRASTPLVSGPASPAYLDSGTGDASSWPNSRNKKGDSKEEQGSGTPTEVAKDAGSLKKSEEVNSVVDVESSEEAGLPVHVEVSGEGKVKIMRGRSARQRVKIYALVEGGHNDIRPPELLDRISQFLFECVLEPLQQQDYEVPLTIVPPVVSDQQQSHVFLCKKFKRINEYEQERRRLVETVNTTANGSNATDLSGADRAPQLAAETRQAAAYRLLSSDYYVIIVVHPSLGLTLVAPWSGVTVGHYWYSDLDQFVCLAQDQIFYFSLPEDRERVHAYHCEYSEKLSATVSKNLDELLRRTSQGPRLSENVRGAAQTLIRRMQGSGQELKPDAISDSLYGALRGMLRGTDKTPEELRSLIEVTVCDCIQDVTGSRPEIKRRDEEQSRRQRLCCVAVETDESSAGSCVIM